MIHRVRFKVSNHYIYVVKKRNVSMIVKKSDKYESAQAYFEYYSVEIDNYSFHKKGIIVIGKI